MSSAIYSIPLIADPVVPQRDLLLDSAAVAEIFSCHLGVNGPVKIDRCIHLRTTYHAGESLRVAYRVSAEGESCIVSGRAFPANASGPAFTRVKITVPDCGPFRPVFHDAPTESIFWTFPNDRKIPHLRLLTEIPAALAEKFNGRWVKSNLVAYAPEKCVTAQCLTDQGDVLAYAKVYADAHSAACFQTYASLRQSMNAVRPEIHFPAVLFHSEQHHLLVLQVLHGKRMAELSGSELRNAFTSLGQKLATLHSLPAPSHLPEFERTQDAHIQLASTTIGLVRPELAQLASDLSSQLCIQRAEFNEANVCLHGDVHPKNGVLLDNEIGLIDMDQASLGPRAADIGSMLAALRYERHIGLLTEEAEQERAHAFLNGYKTRARLPEPESLRWHIASALFAERAFRSVSRIRVPGLMCLPELLMDTRQVLTEGY
jgi:tRNA A-37 threonylcarbamoyl transferase component Bud32